MRRPVPSVVVGLVLLLVSASVLALGLGRVRSSSFLGDSLDFTVALLAQPGDPVLAECVRADVYSGDSRIPDDLVRVIVNRAANGAPVSLRVVTATRIDEPLARVDLSLQCGTSIRRSYVVFIDPPTLDLARTDRFASADIDAGQSTSRRSAAAAASSPRRASRQSAQRGSGTAAVARSAGSGAARSEGRQAPAAAPTAARKARETVAAAAQRDAAGSSLRLESTPVPRPGAAPAGGLAQPASAPAPVGDATPGGSAAPSASSAVSGLLGELAAKAEADAQIGSAEKMRGLEQDLNRLRSDNDALKRSSAELQARLREAEQDRSSNTLIYGLLAALLLLLLAVVALLIRQAAQRRDADWLQAAAEAPPSSTTGTVRSIVHPSTPGGSHAGAEAAATAAARLSEAATTPGPRPALAAAAAARTAAPAAMDAADRADAPPPRPSSGQPGPYERTAIQEIGKEVSVDELIDLEQQADFFEVLGQDDAAIDLLMGHLQGAGAASPLPYLKLLEIHRRRGERAAYDRVRERFNRRFTAFAPEWDAHSGHGRGLGDYPQVIERLQRHWATPIVAMNMMTELLFKQHESGETFDLTAYGELLFLYSVARDLAEGEAAASGVDLLLPLGAGAAPTAGAGDEAARGPASQPAPSIGAFRAEEQGYLADLPAALPGSGRAVGKSAATPPAGAVDSMLPALDFDLPDLGLRNEPAEPKGPLSKD